MTWVLWVYKALNESASCYIMDLIKNRFFSWGGGGGAEWYENIEKKLFARPKK